MQGTPPYHAPIKGRSKALAKKMRYRRLERYPFMSSSSRLRSLRSLRAVKARYAIATAAIAATITSTGAKMSRAAMTDTIPSDTNRAQDTPCAPYSAACVPQGARIACLEMQAENWAPHKGRTRHAPQARHRTGGTSATRPGPRTEQKGTLATRRDPRTARGTHLSRAAARAYAGDPRAGSAPLRGTRAATRTPRRNKHTLSRILRVQHSRLRRTIHRATQTTERWRADVRARTRISPMQAGTMVRHVSFSSEGAP